MSHEVCDIFLYFPYQFPDIGDLTETLTKKAVLKNSMGIYSPVIGYIDVENDDKVTNYAYMKQSAEDSLRHILYGGVESIRGFKIDRAFYPYGFRAKYSLSNDSDGISESLKDVDPEHKSISNFISKIKAFKTGAGFKKNSEDIGHSDYPLFMIICRKEQIIDPSWLCEIEETLVFSDLHKSAHEPNILWAEPYVFLVNDSEDAATNSYYHIMHTVMVLATIMRNLGMEIRLSMVKLLEKEGEPRQRHFKGKTALLDKLNKQMALLYESSSPSILIKHSERVLLEEAKEYFGLNEMLNEIEHVFSLITNVYQQDESRYAQTLNDIAFWAAGASILFSLYQFSFRAGYTSAQETGLLAFLVLFLLLYILFYFISAKKCKTRRSFIVMLIWIILFILLTAFWWCGF